ncbi:MAG: hypothetical protein ACRYG7_34905 [Janthinobacterium lividum]
MNQEQLARQMHGVVYTQRKLSYLKEKLDELLAHNPLSLAPGQRTLSAADVEAATEHEGHLNDAEKEIAQEESTTNRLTEALLLEIPEMIKKLIRQGMPLVAQWQKDGIDSLALVYEEEIFKIIPNNSKA